MNLMGNGTKEASCCRNVTLVQLIGTVIQYNYFRFSLICFTSNIFIAGIYTTDITKEKMTGTCNTQIFR